MMTLAGLAAGRAYPAGLPPGVGALSKQVAATLTLTLTLPLHLTLTR